MVAREPVGGFSGWGCFRGRCRFHSTLLLLSCLEDFETSFDKDRHSFHRLLLVQVCCQTPHELCSVIHSSCRP